MRATGQNSRVSGHEAPPQEGDIWAETRGSVRANRVYIWEKGPGGGNSTRKGSGAENAPAVPGKDG